MRRIIFYSWQSDLPNATNRGLIQKALEVAAHAIAADDSVAVEPVIDRDTAGVPGSPDIAATIFGKISASDVFVADVSIISKPRKGRATPNPNVLIELGYALKAVGPERVILVFNEAYGKFADLPFDLRTRRVLTYKMPEETAERAPERAALAGKLEEALRWALGHAPAPQAEVNPVFTALEEGRPNRVLLVRRTLEKLFTDIEARQPRKHSEGGTVDDLIAAIGQTQELVAEFSKLAETIAAMNDIDSGIEAATFFGRMFEKCDTPAGFSGSFSNADFDYYKFLTHEMIVTLFAYPLREQRWDLLKRLLQEPIILRHSRRLNGPQSVDWGHAISGSYLLIDEGQKRSRISLQADILKERHTLGGLGAILPMDELMAADFFLYLNSIARVGWRWLPWTLLFMTSAPVFLLKAERKETAERLAATLGMTVTDLKSLLIEKAPEVRRLFDRGFWDYPIGADLVARIGTK